MDELEIVIMEGWKMDDSERGLEEGLISKAGQRASCVLEGTRYIGRFEAEREKSKNAYGHTDFSWNGHAVIRDNQTGEEHELLFGMLDRHSSCPKPNWGLERGILRFRRHGQQVETPMFTDVRAVADIVLTDMLTQLKVKEAGFKGKTDDEADKIPKLYLWEFDLLEFMGHGLISEVSVDDVVDSAYLNLRERFNADEQFNLRNHSLEFGDYDDGGLLLGCADQGYEYTYEGFAIPKPDDTGVMLVLKIGHRQNHHKLPVVVYSGDTFNLRALGNSLVYMPLDVGEFEKLKQLESDSQGQRHKRRFILTYEVLPRLVAPYESHEFRDQQLLRIGKGLFRGQLVYDGNKITVVGTPVEYRRMDNDKPVYDGKLVPNFIDAIAQRVTKS